MIVASFNMFRFRSTIGILGPACSDTVEPIAGVSKHFKTVVISYRYSLNWSQHHSEVPWSWQSKSCPPNHNHNQRGGVDFQQQKSGGLPLLLQNYRREQTIQVNKHVLKPFSRHICFGKGSSLSLPSSLLSSSSISLCCSIVMIVILNSNQRSHCPIRHDRWLCKICPGWAFFVGK